LSWKQKVDGDIDNDESCYSPT